MNVSEISIIDLVFNFWKLFSSIFYKDILYSINLLKDNLNIRHLNLNLDKLYKPSFS